MWKVLIADDEPKIRRGLRTSIERTRPDMRVVAEAEDGETALSLVDKERPDILLIDVRMPFLNGLELIEKINALSLDCIIIVVSGHDEFEYAQRALQLKVFEYVLKPVPQDVLAGVLARAEEALGASRRERKYVAWAHDQLDRNMPLLREQFLRDCVHARLAPLEITEQSEFLDMQVSGPLAMAVIHVVDRTVATGHAEERDRRIALYAVRSAVEETFAEFSPLWVFLDEHDDVIVLARSRDARPWLEAITRTEARVVPSLCSAVVMAHAAVENAPLGVSECYEQLSAEISSKGGHRSLVVLAQRYIDAHFGEPTLSLEEVASSAQISPGYLSRLLKLETGFSFVDYLTRVRINRAVQIMNDPAVKVYEVAEAVGYQSQHYFSRAFKRVFGRPPVEYRKGGA
jgi:two-component system response regulator YesN